jgi:hypothetical protein
MRREEVIPLYILSLITDHTTQASTAQVGQRPSMADTVGSEVFHDSSWGT